MSKFDLRDISDRLTASRSTEAVVFEFLGYLQAQRGDWKASLAFYEVSRDALVCVYERHENRLVRKDVTVFNTVSLRFHLDGVTQAQGVGLVERFKAR